MLVATQLAQLPPLERWTASGVACYDLRCSLHLGLISPRLICLAGLAQMLLASLLQEVEAEAEVELPDQQLAARFVGGRRDGEEHAALSPHKYIMTRRAERRGGDKTHGKPAVVWGRKECGGVSLKLCSLSHPDCRWFFAALHQRQQQQPIPSVPQRRQLR